MAADKADENALANLHGALIYIFETGKTSRKFPCELFLVL
jgi:hypothetical protein